MNFVHSLFIFTTIILINSLTVAFENTDIESIENVYINTLIKRYMTVESSLWDEINKSQNKSNELILKILHKHSEFFSNESFESVINDELMMKFEKYLILTSGDDQNATKFSNATVLSDFNSNLTLSDNLFDEIRKDTESQSCDNISTQLIESANHNIFLFYQLFMALMLASYAHKQRLKMLQEVQLGSVNDDHKHLTFKFNDEFQRIRDLAVNQMREANDGIWMCDLDFYIKDDESIQITNLLQGYVENEVNMNKESSCSGSCNDYKFARNHHCASGTFCGDQVVINGSMDHICSGTIVDCTYVEWGMTICPAYHLNKRRRLDNIKYSSGRFMGREFCIRDRHKIKSYLTKWLTICSYCFCYCDADNANSERYFSLRPSLSDVSQNKIITGIGLVKRNGIFSWSITQSTLRSNGRVHQLQNRITKSYSSSDPSADELYQDFHLTQDGVEADVDYRKLSWQNRSINLATVLVPQGCVITGIRFTVLKEHLNFELRSTRFDFNEGLLYGPSEWIGNKNEKRSVLLIDKPEPSHPITINSTNCERSIPYFTTNKFVKFRPSDPDKDLGQTTVPFIDTQMVRPKQLTLLSGVSLYYKGRPGYGGFIAPKLIAHDMSKYLKCYNFCT